MVINPIVGVYIPIIRIPIKGVMTIPNIATFDRGTSLINPATSIGVVIHIGNDEFNLCGKNTLM